MKGLFITDEGIKYLDFKLPNIKEGEVLVNIKACGICGSDIPRLLEGKTHFKPIIAGHEASGIVTKSNSNHFNCGDNVIIVPLISCMKCIHCLKGAYALCKNYKFIGSSRYGAMADYCIVPEQNLIKFNMSELNYVKAACIEPITVGIHAIERIPQMDNTKDIIVFGCGTIGLFLIQSLLALGYKNIIAIENNPNKLEIAKSLGIKSALLSTDLTTNIQGTYLFETTGISDIQSIITRYCSDRGYIVLIGTAHKEVIVNPKDFELILRKELFITGSWMSYSSPFPGDEWNLALKLLKENKINTDVMISNKVKMIDVIKTIENRNSNTLKIMIIND